MNLHMRRRISHFLLQDPHAKAAAESARQRLEDTFAEALPVLSALDLPPSLRNLNAWLWAAGTIATRCMHLPGNSAGCLTPLADMFNYWPPEAPVPPNLPARKLNGAAHSMTPQKQALLHAPTAGVGCSEPAFGVTGEGAFDSSAGRYRFYTRKAHQAGEQLFLCYGHYTNLQLLQFYGFLLPYNPHDQVVCGQNWPVSRGTEADKGLFFHPGAEVHFMLTDL